MPKDSSLMRSKSYVNGEWVDAQSGNTYPVYNPATNELIGNVADMGKADVDNAVAIAETAMVSWKTKTSKERAAVMMKWYDLILENQEDLAVLMTKECGKPLAESRGEVVYGASFIQWFAEECKRTNGDTIPSHTGDRRLMTIKQPVGVCAAVTPWNFPIAMITRKCGPAIAAGCSILVKPAEATPFSALALAELAERAGIPAGVFNVITAGNGAEVGKAMTDNPTVRKMSFTGSTAVGKILLRQCADTVKKVSMELGGNAPFIVFDDADLDAAVQGAMAAKYRNSGQTCVCTNRLLLQDSIHDEFLAKYTEAVKALKVGNGLEAGITQGPLINRAAVEKVETLVAQAVSKGATVVTGGKRSDAGDNFYQPTILTDMKTDMDIFSNEIFGPVTAMYKFKTEDEAVSIANDTQYGLAAYFYSRDIGRCMRVAENLEYGMVGINEGIISTEVAPFGGIKESGLGREGSKCGIEEYTETKYMCFGGM